MTGTNATPDPTEQIADRLAETYERIARALDHSAALAESHADRHGQAGHQAAAEDEHLAADRARTAANQARTAAEHARKASHRRSSLARGRKLSG